MINFLGDVNGCASSISQFDILPLVDIGGITLDISAHLEMDKVSNND